MSDWGDEGNGIEAEPFDVDESTATGEPGRLLGVDIQEFARSVAGPALHQVVQKAVTAAVRDAMQGAVDEALDPTVLEELHAQAATAAARAVSDELAALDADPEPVDEPTLYYGSVDEFVREYLVNAYRRRVDGQRTMWAADWWKYDEAVIRLEALWRSWEELRLNPATGMSVWWRDHADHHMSILLSADGPFAAAGEGGPDRPNTNEKGQPLPYTAPPAGMFPDVR
ncbi:DUF4913 domain-containing protein [Microbacterium sp. ZW CA_36]|uniref:DUF4913 domain-containing protein n=1 Tax=Microbacterium sp. ZW CA_36 TaxID=3378078 RepID=UPI00385520CF